MRFYKVEKKNIYIYIYIYISLAIEDEHHKNTLYSFLETGNI